VRVPKSENRRGVDRLENEEGQNLAAPALELLAAAWAPANPLQVLDEGSPGNFVSAVDGADMHEIAHQAEVPFW